MALPSAGMVADATAKTPSSAISDFGLLVRLGDLPSAWWDDVNTSDGTRGRASDPTGTVEYAVDWIDFDSVGRTGIARVMVPGQHGTLTPIGLRLYAPNTRNASVAATDTFGQHAAYRAEDELVWPGHDLNDRTSHQRHGTAGGGISVGGVAEDAAINMLGPATQATATGHEVTFPDVAGLEPGTDDWTVLASIRQDDEVNRLAVTSRTASNARGYEFVFGTGSIPQERDARVRSGFGNVIIGSTGTKLVSNGGEYQLSSLTVDTAAQEFSFRVEGTTNSVSDPDIGSEAITNAQPLSTHIRATTQSFVSMQHVRVSRRAWSDAEIDHEADQVMDQAGFWGGWTATQLGNTGGFEPWLASHANVIIGGSHAA